MMMMIGDPPELNPTVQIPSWDYQSFEDLSAHIQYPVSTQNVYPNSPDNIHYENAFAALQRYLPSNKEDAVVARDEDSLDFELPVDAFSCDNFRMFEFKVKKCARARSHDWTECPFAHPGEKARRRDPRKFHYSGTACPDFRRGACSRGDSCEYAHGVFECWLHPARYRTQPCKDGTHCRRRVCFFAHTAEQLRFLPTHLASPDGSPSRLGYDSVAAASMFGSSPPLSPTAGSLESVNHLAESLQGLQINKMKMGLGLGLGLGLSVSPPAWQSGFGSPRSASITRPVFASLPSTPIGALNRSSLAFDTWEIACEEEQTMERVESGRGLREKLYAKLGKENSLMRVGRVEFPYTGHDVGPVSDLPN